ncbi:MAG: TadE/TadG family type IV pilus assembly protein [Acidimicrobiia bacterium]
MPRRRDERGLATIELVLMTPVLFLVLSFLVVAGRLTTVRGDVAAAARDAARVASRAATFDQATEQARLTAEASLGGRDVTCRDLTVELEDPATFRAGGTVAVRVACGVSLADVAIPGLPGARTIEHRSVEVIDVYRGGE